MKILVLNYEFPPIGGGGASVCYEIAKRYVGKGHEVDVVTAGFRGLPSKQTIDGFTLYRVNCLRSRQELSYPHELLSFVFSAKRFLRNHLNYHRYDICHAHFLLPTGIVALALKEKLGLPYIISAHGSDVPGYNVDRFKILHWFTPPLLKKICDGAEHIITSSDYLASLVRQNIHPYPDGKIINIPNGIDCSKFVPLKKDNIVLSSGRFLPRKGFQHLIKAVSEVDLGFTVHLCGDGPMRPQLQRLSEASRTRIVFHGWVDNRSAFYRDLLGVASIFVLPSAAENASVGLLEGMSAGCAVVTSNVSGCPETVGSSGIVVNPTDAGAIKVRLVELTGDPDLRRRFQQMARERVEKVFSWDRIVDRYHSLLEEPLRAQAACGVPWRDPPRAKASTRGL
ncbi:MAG: glycosyltransferase family 4 protein [Gammaproteobacteria bacterium]